MFRIARSAASLALFGVLALAGCQHEPAQAGRDSGASSVSRSQPQSKSRAGVGAANPLAVEAGLAILKHGGNAIDAAVAVQAALGLVEPQSSGLGGGAFMLYLDGRTGQVTAYDGREAAPAGATPDMFIGANGDPLSYADAVTSGRSTGAPGAIAMLGLAHDRHGQLQWRDLFDTATHAADEGFRTPKRLARYVNGDFPQSKLANVVALYSRADGTPLQAGDQLRNPAYAATLRKIAADGPRTLLQGPIAERVAARTHDEPRPGTMTAADLAAYRPHEVQPVCRPYRVYVVCVPPPPSSGAALLQMLAILAHTDIAARGPSDPQAWFLFAEASRLIYADRDQYIADPAFVRVPVDGLLDPAYVATRAALISRTAGPPPEAGDPPGLTARLGRDATTEAAGTSHFVVVDKDGNVVSMTTSVESIFGSGRAVDGFFLNNQLTDFSFRAVDDGRPVANAVAPGKRPRSSMSPVLVLDRDGHFVAALGSPGGSAILTYNAKTIVGLLDWGLTMQQAIELPNLYARGSDFYGEVSKFPPDVLAALAERGVVVKSGRGEESGLHGVVVRGGGMLEGGVDPRREGEWRELAFK